MDNELDRFLEEAGCANTDDKSLDPPDGDYLECGMCGHRKSGYVGDTYLIDSMVSPYCEVCAEVQMKSRMKWVPPSINW